MKHMKVKVFEFFLKNIGIQLSSAYYSVYEILVLQVAKLHL